MRSLGRFFEISWGERWLLLKALMLLWIVRPALWLIPFQITDMWCERLGKLPKRGARDTFTPHQVAWAVKVASRFVPAGSHCLSQSKVTWILLERRGFSSVIRFGVLKDGHDNLCAHSWVECLGETVIGGEELDRFVELLAPQGRGTGEGSKQPTMRVPH